jgi:hypothetical protein
MAFEHEGDSTNHLHSPILAIRQRHQLAITKLATISTYIRRFFPGRMAAVPAKSIGFHIHTKYTLFTCVSYAEDIDKFQS